MEKDYRRQMYESIMTRISKMVKQRLNESNGESLLRDYDDDVHYTVHDEGRIADFMKGKSVGAYDPRVKPGSSEKDWNLYAVKVTDIKECRCTYLGWNEGWPDYWTSGMTLYGKISIIKAGNGQNAEPWFAGKLVIENDPQRKCLKFTPYKCEDNYEQMSSYRSDFYHFVHRCVVVPYDDFKRELVATNDRVKSLVEDLSRGYRSDGAVKELIKQGYLEIKDNTIVKKEKKKDD